MIIISALFSLAITGTFIFLAVIATRVFRFSREIAEIKTQLAEVTAQNTAIATQNTAMTAQVEAFARDTHQDFATQRAELSAQLHQQAALAEQKSATQLQSQQELWTRFDKSLSQLTTTNEQKLEAIRKSLEERLDVLRHDNAQKLDQMRATVDEKLQTTLETRLGESFKQVADRLEQVYKGLGEMQTLAVGVGDLKRVLSNVKTRGTWGEAQLAALLSEMLTPQQYAENIATIPGSRERVEFAIRLPGQDKDSVCWLPIDAKFPLESWQRLQEALEAADLAAAEKERAALAAFIKESAKTIHDKYVEPPHTTDFAILFVPSEGLYAELMARAGFAGNLQRDFRVMLAGPNNLLALLSSLQMGFRTLAIEQRSAEVWQVLAAVKTEFSKFGEVLAKTSEKLDQAKSTIEAAGVRTRAIARKLRDVEELPESDAQRLLSAD